jgi:adenylate kinase family enzyme
MRRVCVLASASGCGKTTVARALAERLGVRFVELDALVHGPNWTETPDDELRAKVAPIVASDGWVIDGSYSRKLGTLVLDRAETIVWLDLPIRVWLPRLVGRTARRIVTREELWNGNRESLRAHLTERPTLVGWAWRKHFENRRTLPARTARHPNARLVRLRSRREVMRFLRRVQ